MTLNELEALDTEVLTPRQIAPVLGFNPQNIRIQAHEAPDKLGFTCIVIGTRVRIPKRPFLAFMRGQSEKGAST